MLKIYLWIIDFFNETVDLYHKFKKEEKDYWKSIRGYNV